MHSPLNHRDTYSGVNCTRETAPPYGLPTATGLHDGHAATTWALSGGIRKCPYRASVPVPGEFQSRCNRLLRGRALAFLCCGRSGVAREDHLARSRSSWIPVPRPMASGLERARDRARVARRRLPLAHPLLVSRNSLLDLSPLRGEKPAPTTPARMSVMSYRLRVSCSRGRDQPVDTYYITARKK